MSEDYPAHDPPYPELKFADVFVDRILNGEKTSTFRIALDPEIEEGKPCWLCDSDGDRIVLKRIQRIYNMTIKEAAKAEFSGHKSYASEEKLVEAMRMYYPDRDVHEHTRIDVVKWDA